MFQVLNTSFLHACSDKENCFALITPTETLTTCAANDEEREAWVKAINLALCQQTPVDEDTDHAFNLDAKYDSGATSTQQLDFNEEDQENGTETDPFDGAVQLAGVPGYGPSYSSGSDNEEESKRKMEEFVRDKTRKKKKGKTTRRART